MKYRIPTLNRGRDYSKSLNRWVVRTGLSRLLDVQRQAEQAGTKTVLPTFEQLKNHLEDLLFEHAEYDSDYDTQGHGRKGVPTDSDLFRLAANAAQFVLHAYDPEYLERRRRGGRKSRKHTRFTPSMLKPLKGLSKAQQALALKASTATVAVLRRIQKLRDEALDAKERLTYTTGQGFDILNAEIEADFWVIARGGQPPPRVLARMRTGSFA